MDLGLIRAAARALSSRITLATQQGGGAGTGLMISLAWAHPLLRDLVQSSQGNGGLTAGSRAASKDDLVVTAINEMSRTAVSVSESAATAQWTSRASNWPTSRARVVDQAMASVTARW